MSPDEDSDEITHAPKTAGDVIIRASEKTTHYYRYSANGLSKAQCRRLRQKDRLDRYKNIPFGPGKPWPNGYLKAEREYCKLAEQMFYKCRDPNQREMLRTIVLGRRADFFDVWHERQKRLEELKRILPLPGEL